MEIKIIAGFSLMQKDAVDDILEHFLSRADWIDRDDTVDRVIAGDADADVDRCMVTWMPSSKAVCSPSSRRALSMSSATLPTTSSIRAG